VYVVRESAEFDRACEDPILSSRKIGKLFPGLQPLQQFACDLQEAAEMKLTLNAKKYPIEEFKGSDKKYNE
jgi:hypothetical protein